MSQVTPLECAAAGMAIVQFGNGQTTRSEQHGRPKLHLSTYLCSTKSVIRDEQGDLVRKALAVAARSI